MRRLHERVDKCQVPIGTRCWLNAAIVATALAVPAFAAAQSSAEVLAIPKSVQAEHKEIHSALVKATRAKGAVGSAAKEVAKVLDPHFKREEQIALPPLGLLADLAAGKRIPESAAKQALKMSDSLKAELPGMLEEHKRIRAAVEKFAEAARAEGASGYERLAEQLAMHAQTEEEVFYPAAVLVGDVLRARAGKK